MPVIDLDRFAAVLDRHAPHLTPHQVAFRWLLGDPDGAADAWPDTDIVTFHTPAVAARWLAAATDSQPSLDVAGRLVVGVSLSWLTSDGRLLTVAMSHLDGRVGLRPNAEGLVVLRLAECNQFLAGNDLVQLIELATASTTLVRRITAVRC